MLSLATRWIGTVPWRLIDGISYSIRPALQSAKVSVIVPSAAMSEMPMPTVPRIIGGFTPKCTQRGIELYKNIVKAELIPTDCITAEIAKVTENAVFPPGRCTVAARISAGSARALMGRMASKIVICFMGIAWQNALYLSSHDIAQRHSAPCSCLPI